MDHKLIRAIGSVTCVMLLVKVLAMIKNILQARVYGAGVDADVFTLASSYSISLFTTMSYALCIAAIPILTQKLLSGKETCYQTANVLIANTMVLSLGATGVLFFAGAVGIIDPLLGIESNIPLFRFCFLVMVLSLPIITLTYLLLALFQTMGHFTLQGRLSLLYNLALCAVLLLAQDRLSLRGFAVVTSVGWLLQLAMVLPSMRQEAYRFRPKLAFRQGGYGSFLRTSVMTMYVSSLFLLCYLVNTRFATAGVEGTVTGFFYAERLYEPLSTALIYSAGIVLFPNFSQKYAEMEEPAYREYVIRILKNTLLVMLPVSLLFGAFGTPVIRVLFEGGDFNTHNALLSGGVFSMYTLGLAGFLILDLLSKAYFAMGRPLPPIGMPRRSWGSAWAPTRCSPILCRRGRSCWPLGRRWAFCWWGALRISSLPGKGALPSPGNLCFAAAGFPWGLGAWLGRCTTCKWHPWIPKGGWLWFAAP